MVPQASSKRERQDLFAEWRIEISKESSSVNKYSERSRNYFSRYFNADFPAYFYSKSSKKSERADVRCDFREETRTQIFYRCTARANVNVSDKYDLLEAWIYRIQIPGYERNKHKMLVRLRQSKQNEIRPSTKDFVDPINHKQVGSPEAQKLLIPISAVSTEFNYKDYKTFDVSRLPLNESIIGSNGWTIGFFALGFFASFFAGLSSKNARVKWAKVSSLFAVIGVLEFSSSLMFRNPLPRNDILSSSKLLDVVDNIVQREKHNKRSAGLSGGRLVNKVWEKAHGKSSEFMIQEISPKLDGLLFSQDCKKKTKESIDILVVGASVAEGWHASHIEKTFWSRLSRLLNSKKTDQLCIGVLASPGIHSDVELDLTREFLRDAAPLAIVLVHAQNDIINPVFNMYRGRLGVDKNFVAELVESTDKFLINSSEIRRLAAAKNVHVFEFIPPSAIDKYPLTNDEKSILVGYASPRSYDWSLPVRLLNSAFDRLSGALSLADNANENYTFVDSRRAFHGQTATLFADIYHFGDTGHLMFAEVIADVIRFWLDQRQMQH